jgi:leucine dehydrogenase
VLVQGFGAVGSRLAQQLRAARAEVLVSDIDPSRIDGFEAVDPAAVMSTECDVYAPCAMGGTITATTVEELRCRVVAGAANNQLADPALADRLHERGILYAPDYVINGGGAIALVGLEQLGWSTAETNAALEQIGYTLRQIYERADAEKISTAAASDAVAEERLRVAS